MNDIQDDILMDSLHHLLCRGEGQNHGGKSPNQVDTKIGHNLTIKRSIQLVPNRS